MSKSTDLAYLAGLFEGEGTVSIGVRQGTYYQLSTNICSTDKEIIDYCNSLWPGSISIANRPGAKTAYYWRLYSGKATAFLEAIQPYVKASRNKTRILVALEFQSQKFLPGCNGHSKQYYKKQDVFYKRMKGLNQRGKASGRKPYKVL